MCLKLLLDAFSSVEVIKVYNKSTTGWITVKLDKYYYQAMHFQSLNTF